MVYLLKKHTIGIWQVNAKKPFSEQKNMGIHATDLVENV